ncbi:MAG: hypothetical protein WCW52_10530 [Elusimicrobiales bacterium]|jgi:hypothetical protein
MKTMILMAAMLSLTGGTWALAGNAGSPDTAAAAVVKAPGAEALEEMFENGSDVSWPGLVNTTGYSPDTLSLGAGSLVVSYDLDLAGQPGRLQIRKQISGGAYVDSVEVTVMLRPDSPGAEYYETESGSSREYVNKPATGSGVVELRHFQYSEAVAKVQIKKDMYSLKPCLIMKYSLELPAGGDTKELKGYTLMVEK